MPKQFNIRQFTKNKTMGSIWGGVEKFSTLEELMEVVTPMRPQAYKNCEILFRLGEYHIEAFVKEGTKECIIAAIEKQALNHVNIKLQTKEV